MGNRENIPFKESKNLILEQRIEEEGEKRGNIITAILDMKDKLEIEPDGVSFHLKDINRDLLLTTLEEEDYNAFEKVFSGEWKEDSDEFKEYMESELEWEKREKMDSGKGPKFFARRNFSTMMRAYFISKSAERALKGRGSKKIN